MKIKSLILGILSLLSANIALAATPASTPEGSSFGPIIFLVAIIAFMYLMVWRPQQKKAKEHRDLVAAVTTGDEVMTNGGVVGTVTAIYESYLEMEIQEGTQMTIQSNAIASVLPKGTLHSLRKQK